MPSPWPAVIVPSTGATRGPDVRVRNETRCYVAYKIYINIPYITDLTDNIIRFDNGNVTRTISLPLLFPRPRELTDSLSNPIFFSAPVSSNRFAKGGRQCGPTIARFVQVEQFIRCAWTFIKTNHSRIIIVGRLLAFF